MASKLAERIETLVRVHSLSHASQDDIDRELAPVREVLEGLQSTAHRLIDRPCWCEFAISSTVTKKHAIEGRDNRWAGIREMTEQPSTPVSLGTTNEE